MMYKYKYKGNLDVHVPTVGNIKQEQVVITMQPINHPDFEELKEDVKPAENSKGEYLTK